MVFRAGPISGQGDSYASVAPAVMRCVADRSPWRVTQLCGRGEDVRDAVCDLLRLEVRRIDTLKGPHGGRRHALCVVAKEHR